MVTKYYENASEEERIFLDNYVSDAYEKPSVTADVVIFTFDEDDDLCVLLVKRGEFPYKGFWALPGGFLKAGQESVDETARRELLEETGVSGVFMKQLYTFSDPERDPRMHVISVAHLALLPKCSIGTIKAGDDAEQTKLFKIKYFNRNSFDFYLLNQSEEQVIMNSELLAFDHFNIISMALERLRNRIGYETDGFSLLANSHAFTIYEYKKISDYLLNVDSNHANFRKFFINRFVKSGLVSMLDEKSDGPRPAQLFKIYDLGVDL